MEFIRPYITRLKETGETVDVSEMQKRTVFVDQVTGSAWLNIVFLGRGISPLPGQWQSNARYIDRQRTDEATGRNSLERHTPDTIVDTQRLMKELAKVRKPVLRSTTRSIWRVSVLLGRRCRSRAGAHAISFQCPPSFPSQQAAVAGGVAAPSRWIMEEIETRPSHHCSCISSVPHEFKCFDV